MTTTWNTSDPGPVRIKICGVRTPDDVAAAIDAGADAIGVVFAKASPRYVTASEGRAIADAAGDAIEVVSLYVDPTVEDLSSRAGNWIQLHGDETEEFVAQVAAAAPVIKAVSWSHETVQRWAACRGVSRLLIDGPRGGSGTPFAHEDLAPMRDGLDVPVVVAGGLAPDTVTAVVEILRPWGVDVSSGVESTRGVKDHGMIREFCEAARSG